MKTKKISIVIPAYNTEKYIKKCLDSIINQTYKNKEIIIIDDASTDNTLLEIEKYHDNACVKIIKNKENKGQAYSRNKAIKIASGDYIGFIDSDDFIEPDMLEKLYSKAKENNLDIAMCKIATYDNQTGEIKDNVWYYMLGVFRDFEKDIFNHEDTKEFTCNIAVTPYHKIYKKPWTK